MKSAFRPLIKRRDAIKRACAAVALSALPCAAAAQDKKFYEKQKSAKTREFDVVVCGGGPAGWAAAVSAARAGARTAIIEQQGCLGGIWTCGLVCLIIDWQNKSGLMKELIGVLRSARLCRMSRICTTRRR